MRILRVTLAWLATFRKAAPQGLRSVLGSILLTAAIIPGWVSTALSILCGTSSTLPTHSSPGATTLIAPARNSCPRSLTNCG